MLLYAKTITTTAGDDQPPIDFSRLWERLDFRKGITHVDNCQWYSNTATLHPPGFPDFAASLVAHMHSRKLLSPEYLRDAIRYCKAMVEALHYEPTNHRDLTMLRESTDHVILIFGCQGPEVRDARAAACFNLVDKLRNVHPTLVFSGRNPTTADGRKYILTNNEAGSLRAEFERLVDRASERGVHYTYTVQLEQSAGSTVGNLRHFFTGGYLEPTHNTHLYLLSSTFHLGRIAVDTDRVMQDLPERCRGISRVILVGAEDDEHEEILEEPRYVKAMMYEIFRHIMDNGPFSTDGGSMMYDGAV